MATTVAILGASGRLGREVVAAALARGLAVRALSRHPLDALPAEKVVIGDALDATAVRELVRGTDAVISLVGPSASSSVDRCTRFTRTLLDAMQAERVERLLYVTGVMISHPRELRGTMYRLIPRLMPPLARAQSEDRRRAEEAVRASDRSWTVVRPPRLRDGAPLGSVQFGERLRIGSLAAIRRADLATFLLDAIGRADLSRRAVAVIGR